MRNSLTKITHLIMAVTLMILSLQLSAADPVSYDDPWEDVNRAVFDFNDALDTFTLKPIAKGYNYITPKPVQSMVGNFFSNLGEVRNAANAGLQLKPKEAFTSLSRLAINSTIGMLGLIDVASPMGIEQKYNDFGLTFAHWGAPSGPYVVLPLLGSSTLRDGLGRLPDTYSNPITYHEPERDRWIAWGLGLVNTRAKLLGAEELIVGDRYTFIRDTYLQRREFLITGEQPEDDF
ncbi:hypothetical protein ACH42_02900 [Endozoicomonas sp. (ex Bugula neritina AB1)]|nr:hypothetical protein ACH42_02900 [Endozoicomonas sp. (ex Bugula neritina AB1)]